MAVRSSLRRWHTWLGWLIGIPMLLWTVSGLVMVARPMAEVRGTALLRDPAPLNLLSPPVPPAVAGLPVTRMALEPRASGARWVIETLGGTTRLADPADGRLLAPLSAAEAQREVMARYTGAARVAAVTRVDPAKPPIDLNRPIAAWQVRMTDGTHFYVDSGSGQVVARRTRFWRVYDFMWGLHIMDLQGRKDTNNPWVVSFALFAFVMMVMALMLLPLSARRASPVNPDPADPTN